MSYKRKGQLTKYSEWHKHLRKFGKKFFWKGERAAEKTLVRKEINDDLNCKRNP